MPGQIEELESLALAFALPLLLVSCGRVADDELSTSVDGGRHDSDAAAPVPTQGEQDGFASSVGVGIEACTPREGAAAVTLGRQPEFLTAFHFLPASGCESLDRSAVYRNTGTAPVRIAGITFDRSEFSTSNRLLDTILKPGQAVAIPVRFRGDQSVAAAMTIVTDSGCSTFDVRGVISEDSLFDLSAAALDFGDVVMGGVSEPVILRLQMQFTTLPEGLEDGVSFGVDPEGSFEIISGAQSPVRLASCEPIELQLRFKAPRTPGPVEGGMGYSLGPGDGAVELYGRAVEE